MLVCECISDRGIACIDRRFSSRRDTHRFRYISDLQANIYLARGINLSFHIRNNCFFEAFRFGLNRVGTGRNKAKEIISFAPGYDCAAEILLSACECYRSTGDNISLWIGHCSSNSRSAALARYGEASDEHYENNADYQRGALSEIYFH